MIVDKIVEKCKFLFFSASRQNSKPKLGAVDPNRFPVPPAVEVGFPKTVDPVPPNDDVVPNPLVPVEPKDDVAGVPKASRIRQNS